MRKRMESVDDLIEEAKLRTVWWALCVFAITYFLTHTSKSMWTNVPMSILILAFLRYLSFKVEFRWREQPVRKQTYLSQASKRQLSANDHRLSTVPPVSRWRRKVGSPSVEAAFESFVENILRDFVLDLWYSDITPDREAPELIRGLVLHALGELSGRVKEMNLVDLLTRDMVDLIGSHLDVFRKNQALIGVDVMSTLSSEERDERLKQHLIVSQELHPALLSSEHEYKVLQEIVGGVMALVLRPQDAQSPLVRCFSRELMTCLVLQPVMNFASPIYMNELIICLLNNKDTNNVGGNINMTSTGTITVNSGTVTHDRSSYKGGSQGYQMESRNLAVEPSALVPVNNPGMKSLVTSEGGKSKVSEDDNDSAIQPRQPDWAVSLDAATKRRSQVLAPENLENMWAIGRNYQKKMIKAEHSSRLKVSGGSDNSPKTGAVGKELSSNFNERIVSVDDRYMVNLMQSKNRNVQSTFATGSHPLALQNANEVKSKEGSEVNYSTKEKPHETSNSAKAQLKRCNSTPDIEKRHLTKSNQPMVSGEMLNVRKNQDEKGAGPSTHMEVLLHVPKIRCRVVGAYFEKLGSKSFAVYSIAVTDADNKTCFYCRYRNFERLHRQLKEIPNYSLHLPPKSFLSSSVDDYLVHQRCILLDKYLQDLLSIANIAEQHEVWDFLSASSKNYSAGKSTSVMKTLAVNVDDAMDDIVRQFKGVSDGLKRAVGTSPSSATAQFADSRISRSWNQEETDNHNLHQRNLERAHSLSDGDSSNYEDHTSSVNSGCHSDNEVNNIVHPSNDIKHIEKYSGIDTQVSDQIHRPARAYSDSSNMSSINTFEDPTGIPPEWMPTNVSVPLLNLVDKVFQLKRRGWIRRQVLWISKQILQLVMEDAIDEWIIRQINWLRRDDVIVQGIRWIQDTLWPNGVFFTKVDGYKGNAGTSRFDKLSSGSANQAIGNKKGSSSFELQLEASRNASEVKKLLLDGTPSTLVSIIGYKQYRRSARDIYYFLQSNVCVKQLAYAMLEQVLVTIFPELRKLVDDIHEKGRKEQASFTYQL
ncbi:hypothetical protein U9M48_005139 [Paspalum notatum var. saurae]|uniref:Uncharacterized protein n=1 Tax=Paspalum notatum var. saurae TaxID=547442 RepID=A0AAQ3PRJ1_PASNO